MQSLMNPQISVVAPIMDIIRMDADGDYIPRSVKRSFYAAQCWDSWKQTKYNRSPKAQSVIVLYWSC
jgi:hypothetical protein